MKMRHWFRHLALGAFATVAVATAQSPSPSPSPSAPMPTPVSLAPYQNRAATVFKSDVFTNSGSDLQNASDTVLIGSQLIAAMIIVGGLCFKLRDDHRQMEGIAVMLLKVAFIATIPAWQTRFVSATDNLATSIGFMGQAASPVMSDYWSLLQQWAPPSSPAVDALDAQTPNNTPPSGSEASWSLNAWNWAKGVGVADASMFHALWQTASGSIRALVVFATCGTMACLLSCVIALTYLAELLRYLLLAGGVALLPIFIAGAGIDSLRAHSIRAILGIATVAAWPIGWALANIVSHVIAGGTQTWMGEVAQTAMSALSLPPASFAVAAPYLAWASLFLFVGVTVALAIWQIGMLYYVPALLGRLFSATAGAASSIVAAHFALPEMSAPAAANPARTEAAPGETMDVPAPISSAIFVPRVIPTRVHPLSTPTPRLRR